jgi:hypothetical protein
MPLRLLSMRSYLVGLQQGAKANTYIPAAAVISPESRHIFLLPSYDQRQFYLGRLRLNSGSAQVCSGPLRPCSGCRSRDQKKWSISTRVRNCLHGGTKTSTLGLLVRPAYEIPLSTYVIARCLLFLNITYYLPLAGGNLYSSSPSSLLGSDLGSN